MIEISGALNAMRVAMELAKAGLAARDDSKIKAALSDMAEKFTDANMGALAMSETLVRLRTELSDAIARLADLEKAIQKREAHVLFEVREGAFVYLFDPLPDDETPRHYKCQLCFDSGKESVLSQDVHGHTLHCRINNGHNLVLRPRGVSSSAFRR